MVNLSRPVEIIICSRQFGLASGRPARQAQPRPSRRHPGRSLSHPASVPPRPDIPVEPSPARSRRHPGRGPVPSGERLIQLVRPPADKPSPARFCPARQAQPAASVLPSPRPARQARGEVPRARPGEPGEACSPSQPASGSSRHDCACHPVANFGQIAFCRSARPITVRARLGVSLTIPCGGTRKSLRCHMREASSERIRVSISARSNSRAS